MVLETTWQTPTGWITVHDLLVIGPVQAGGRRADYHRALSDFGAAGALIRIATCISGRVEAVVNCVPLFNYRSTVLAIADDLTKDGLVLRYRVEGTDTGFETARLR